MMRPLRAIYLLLIAFTFASWPTATAVYGQSARKAIVLAWDGAVPAFVHELLGEGKLPNLAKLIAGGAFADDVIAGFPSKTAPGFASLVTGAPPSVTGISGNRVTMTYGERFDLAHDRQVVGFGPCDRED